MKQQFFTRIPYLSRGNIVLKEITLKDKGGLCELRDNPKVYRYLPVFLFEKRYEDPEYVIRHLYDECLKESLILGIFTDDELAGLVELYGYRNEIRKISVGYRLSERFWGKGIATCVLGMMVDYLYNEAGIEIITASTMPENKASERVLKKNGFELVTRNSPEDWGYKEPTLADKWIR